MRLLNSDCTDVMLYGGSRSSKSTTICEKMLINALVHECRQAICRFRFNAVKQSIGMDTLPKVIRFLGAERRIHFDKSDFLFRVRGKNHESEIWLLGLDEKDRSDKILGKEFSTIFFNECSEISWGSVLTAKTRLAQNVPGLQNRCYYDLNPSHKRHWSYRLFLEETDPDSRGKVGNPEDYAFLLMNPGDNAKNLPNSYIEKTLANMSAKMQKRFLLGLYSDENENALWKMETMIAPYRVRSVPDGLEKIVIGVDPAVTNNEKSCHTGIIVVGERYTENGDRHFYVLEDASLVGSPRQWADETARLFRKWEANLVVAEVNQGGDLVETNLRAACHSMPVRKVRATRGKIKRAEPVAAMYEQGRVHHVGEFPSLEDEMCSYTGEETEESPDRMDALVWALTELIGDDNIEIGEYQF